MDKSTSLNRVRRLAPVQKSTQAIESEPQQNQWMSQKDTIFPLYVYDEDKINYRQYMPIHDTITAQNPDAIEKGGAIN